MNNNEELLESADNWLKYSVLYTKATDGASAALQSLAASLLVIARAAATWQAQIDERNARIAELNAQYERNAATMNGSRPISDEALKEHERNRKIVDDFQKAHGGLPPSEFYGGTRPQAKYTGCIPTDDWRTDLSELRRELHTEEPRP